MYIGELVPESVAIKTRDAMTPNKTWFEWFHYYRKLGYDPAAATRLAEEKKPFFGSAITQKYA